MCYREKERDTWNGYRTDKLLLYRCYVCLFFFFFCNLCVRAASHQHERAYIYIHTQKNCVQPTKPLVLLRDKQVAEAVEGPEAVKTMVSISLQCSPTREVLYLNNTAVTESVTTSCLLLSVSCHFKFME